MLSISENADLQLAGAEKNQLSIVEARCVGKKFAKSLGQSLLYGLSDIGRELLLKKEAPKVLRRGEFWALDDVSFELRKGEALAVIGRNGSGKSTLLKLLYGLIKPDTGEIAINGRMAALIELGAGFDPILSGRENVYINASILGLSREEVDDLMEAIVEFSGLREFMETPVKFYSSGMRARLAYSIATNLSPDIFLVDELLAVGDSEFRQKCLRNMVDFVEKGGSLIFVSHTANQIQTVCNRGIVIDSGRVAYEGPTLEAFDHYYRSDLHRPQKKEVDFTPPESPKCSIVSVEIEPNRPVRTGEEVSILITAELREELEIVAVLSILGRDLLTIVSTEDSGMPRLCAPGIHSFLFRIPSLPLMPGLFHVRAALREGDRMLPLANYGLKQSPIGLLVEGDPTLGNVRARAMGQLVRIEGAWA
jgi:lipopolysaccharide transport system ATP-binding protein